jgi:hypothetical protein
MPGRAFPSDPVTLAPSDKAVRVEAIATVRVLTPATVSRGDWDRAASNRNEKMVVDLEGRRINLRLIEYQ